MAVQYGDAQTEGTGVPVARWITASLEVKEGRDPLGLQTTTQDRLTPVLLPGILELSRRGRYFSFHAFLLHEYRSRRLAADSNSLSTFIKRREWELGLAVQRCPRDCGSSPVGARRLGDLSQGAGPFPRGESVESPFGGYGLYYRSPMVELGIVAKAGTLLGDQPIPIDVLYDTDRARRLAMGYREAVADTAYYQRWMLTNDDLPAEVIDEYAEVACLCRLRQRPEERKAVHDALFGVDPPGRPSIDSTTSDEAGNYADGGPPMGDDSVFTEGGVGQRRRSVGHYLTLVESRPDVVTSESAFREAMWTPPDARGDNQAFVAGQWAALIAKDVWQESICSVWSEFCRSGLARSRELGRGLTWDEVQSEAKDLVAGPPVLEPTMPTTGLAAAISAGELVVPGLGGEAVDIPNASIEALRRLTDRIDTATSGLVVLLELARRAEQRSGSGWDQASHIASAWQPSVAAVIAGLRTHLNEQPTVAATLWWLVSRFVIPVHERIAYSKLPEFTFRFRWEDGLLHFYDQGIGRFPLAAIRNEPLSSITWDLALWSFEMDGSAGLTTQGRAFVDEALA